MKLFNFAFIFLSFSFCVFADENFLKKEHFTPKTSPSQQNFTEALFDSFFKNEFYIGGSLGSGYNSRIYETPSNQNEAYYSIAEMNAYYSLLTYGHFQMAINATGSSYQAYNKDVSDTDERSLGGGLDLIFQNLWGARRTLTYYYTYTMGRMYPRDRFSFYSRDQQITYKSTQKFLGGTLTTSVPFNYTAYYEGTPSFGYGYALSYTPKTTMKKWNPTYAIGFNQVDEEVAGIKNSNEGFISFSNYLPWGESLDTFFTIDYYQRNNDEKEYSYNFVGITLQGSYTFFHIPGLYFNLTLQKEFTHYESDESLNTSKGKITLSYSL